MNAIGEAWSPSGTEQRATSAVARQTTGPARNTHVVVVLKTEPLRKSFAEVVVELQDGRPDAPGEERLRLADHAEEERRQEEDDEDVNGDLERACIRPSGEATKEASMRRG